jgi:hypothetical protein
MWTGYGLDILVSVQPIALIADLFIKIQVYNPCVTDDIFVGI